eukprot:g5478.t1
MLLSQTSRELRAPPRNAYVRRAENKNLVPGSAIFQGQDFSEKMELHGGRTSDELRAPPRNAYVRRAENKNLIPGSKIFDGIWYDENQGTGEKRKKYGQYKNKFSTSSSSSLSSSSPPPPPSPSKYNRTAHFSAANGGAFPRATNVTLHGRSPIPENQSKQTFQRTSEEFRPYNSTAFAQRATNLTLYSKENPIPLDPCYKPNDSHSTASDWGKTSSEFQNPKRSLNYFPKRAKNLTLYSEENPIPLDPCYKPNDSHSTASDWGKTSSEFQNPKRSLNYFPKRAKNLTLYSEENPIPLDPCYKPNDSHSTASDWGKTSSEFQDPADVYYHTKLENEKKMKSNKKVYSDLFENVKEDVESSALKTSPEKKEKAFPPVPLGYTSEGYPVAAAGMRVPPRTQGKHHFKEAEYNCVGSHLTKGNFGALEEEKEVSVKERVLRRNVVEPHLISHLTKEHFGGSHV